ncbi:hypothetical protein KFL_017080010, partial [Klebsormidium nitens]
IQRRFTEGWTRWAYVRYMGAYENGNGFRAPFFISEAEFRAVRYHIMDQKGGASEKGEGKYTLRPLLAHESPAGMFGTPGYYPIRTSGSSPAVSFYSEYFCMLAGALPPYQSYTVKTKSDAGGALVPRSPASQRAPGPRAAAHSARDAGLGYDSV